MMVILVVLAENSWVFFFKFHSTKIIIIGYNSLSSLLSERISLWFYESTVFY